MDIQELKQILSDKLEENRALIESKFEIIELKLNNIQEQTTKTNGRVTALENEMIIVQKNEIKHNLACPQLPIIRDLQRENDNQKSIKNFFIKSLAVIGGLIGQ
jgi:hypothetical protein